MKTQPFYLTLITTLLLISLYYKSSTQTPVLNFDYNPLISNDIVLHQQFENNTYISDIHELWKAIISEDLTSANDSLLYWMEGDPGYRWFIIMSDLSKAFPEYRNGGRMLALHIGQYDALIHEVALHQTNIDGRNSTKNKTLNTFSSHELVQRALVAMVSGEILKYYFVKSESSIDRLVKSAVRSYYSTKQLDSLELETIITIAHSVKENIIRYAQNDNTDLEIDTVFTKNDSLWYGRPGKNDIAKGKWRPFTLDAKEQYRPKPPPNFTEDMEALRQFNNNNTFSDKAWAWKVIPFWDNVLDEKILAAYSSGQIDNLMAAFIRATFHVARYDATISAWEAKYYYMGIRPFQLDDNFKPILIHTPNFPGYPAGHTAVSGALETILSFFFPLDKERFIKMSEDCSASRFEGGVHFQTDNEVGLEVGRNVGLHVLNKLIIEPNKY